MDLLIERVDVWAASISDKAGGLAQALAALQDAGADLRFIIARRTPDAPGKGVVFVTPLCGDREVQAAAQVGFGIANSLHSLRIAGHDRPGIAAELTGRLDEAGINLRGFSASLLGTQFIAYVALDSLDDANRAMEILQKA